ncbi:putative peptidoglycan biosynthesis protein MurJ [Burkholderiales bacterium]|nr:putative peptidoglycan biosynthesis protein MurJ [Burkholderiales bacterium]
MNLLRAAARVSGLTMLSRISGLLRDLLIARFFGAGIEMDAFTVAFRIPNLLRRLFAEGAFAQAFVPIFSEVKIRQGPERTRVLLSHVASALFWVLLAVSILGVAGAPLLVAAIATGFRHSPAFDLATLLTRWMFPYILFMSLIACSGGVLNAFGRFAIPAFTPVLLNVSMIALTLLVGRSLEPPILVLAIAVVLGGVLQLSIQVPALLRLGMLPRLSSVRAAFADAGVRRILRQMLPAVFAVSVAQLSLIINTNIASHLGTGSNSWLYYADRLMELPTALLGVAIGTVLLPTLSTAHAAGDREHYRKLLDWGLRLTCLLALPAALGLAVLADGLIGALFQGGRFSAYDVAQSAAALRGYALGLLGLIGVKILAPGFYARQDIRTPVRIGVMVLAATQLANLALVPWLATAALAWSIGIGALFNCLLLLRGLHKRQIYSPGPEWRSFGLRLAIALAGLTLALIWIEQHYAYASVAPVGALGRIAWLLAAVGGAAAVYAALLWLIGFRPRDFVLRTREAAV